MRGILYRILINNQVKVCNLARYTQNVLFLKKTLSIFIFVFASLIGLGQLEITSVLVNACGNEGFSEVVEFTNGNNPTDISLIYGAKTNTSGSNETTPFWTPCQNGTTAGNVAAI